MTSCGIFGCACSSLFCINASGRGNAFDGLCVVVWAPASSVLPVFRGLARAPFSARPGMCCGGAESAVNQARTVGFRVTEAKRRWLWLKEKLKEGLRGWVQLPDLRRERRDAVRDVLDSEPPRIPRTGGLQLHHVPLLRARDTSPKAVVLVGGISRGVLRTERLENLTESVENNLLSAIYVPRSQPFPTRCSFFFPIVFPLHVESIRFRVFRVAGE